MAARATSIWWWAFGYFAAYAPYSFLTKALSEGHLGPPVPGEAILPLSTATSLVAMVVFLAATGWWRSAARQAVGPWRLPVPTRWTALSGLCGATILTTTTLAYTFEGVSIVLMMLLMRGGVLLLAPIVDAVSGRRVQGRSWVALGLTTTALVVATVGGVRLKLTLPAMADVAAYVAAYFVRLRFMSRLAKSDDPEVTRRYFVEEQLVSTPAALAGLVALALLGQGRAVEALREGFGTVPFAGQAGWVVAVGVLSQGTGIFGALVLLDKAENSYSVPVNRASSVLAGLLATVALWVAFGTKVPPPGELVGAALVVAAVVVLSWPTSARPAPPTPVTSPRA